ncbi:HNH endonuclease [Streptomyces sp. NPDC055037]
MAAGVVRQRAGTAPPISNHPLTGGAERGCKLVWSPQRVRTGTNRRGQRTPTDPTARGARYRPPRGDPYALRRVPEFESRGGHTTTTHQGDAHALYRLHRARAHRGRCKTHHGAYEGRPNVRSRRARGRRRATRRDAAARLRRRVQERGSAWCDWCLGDFPADGVDVDHVRPLALGGEDTDSNVQVLCHGCHVVKTRTEFGDIHHSK